MTSEIDWDNIFKIRIRNFAESADKHDVVKLLIMRKLVRKHNKQKNWIRIYSEHPVTIRKQTRVADILFEDTKKKSRYAFEIQKEVTSQWAKEVTDFYRDWDLEISNIFFKTANLIVIPLEELSDNLPQLNKQLDKYIV